MGNFEWGPVVTGIGVCAAIISTMAVLMLRTLKEDLREMGRRHTNLYTWSENKFVSKEVCDERHREE